MPVRVYDLSKEVGISNKELIEKLAKMGIKVKSQSSTIDKITAESIRNEYGIFTPAQTKPVKQAAPSAAVESKPATGVAPVSPPVAPPPAPPPCKEAVSASPSPPAAAEPAVAQPQTPRAEPPTVAVEQPPPPPAVQKPPHPAVTQAGQPPTVVPPSVVRPLSPPRVIPSKLPPSPPPPPVTAGGVLHMKPPIVVKDLAARLGLKPYQLISELMEMNVFATINQTIDEAAARKACMRHGVRFELEKRERHIAQQPVAPPRPVVPKEKAVEVLKTRPPVVTFMGHVDHGKTSLLDAIRKTNVAAREAGGITQHIGAYTVEVPGLKKGDPPRKVVFLDTPGHEAFTAMRARGANLTDIVVLVVAADDGVMPQTIEAINHARAANVPIIVAVNKIDLATANPERVKRQLQEQGLTPEEWGGQTIFCEVSATTKQGLDNLLEMILLQAEIMEIKANPQGPAKGNVIESQMGPAGPTSTVLVRSGTLRVGDPLLCDKYYGKVKALTDWQGKRLKEAGPSDAVKVLGLNGLPLPGQPFTVAASLEAARLEAEARSKKAMVARAEPPKHVTLEDLFRQMEQAGRKELRLVIKADVQGSVEAIGEALKKLKSDKISLNIIHAAVGPVTENDVLLASASDAIIVGFHVKVEPSAGEEAKRQGVQIKLYSIIYELLEQVEQAMQGMLEPETRETILGHAEIRQVFEISKGKVAGCVVSDGRILRNSRARLLRRQQVQIETRIASLKRFQDDVQEVRAGLDCGIRLENFSDYQPGDVIECYQVEKIPQKL